MTVRRAFLTGALSLCGLVQTAPAATDQEVFDGIVAKLLGTIFVVPHTESADGKMTGCGLEYSVLARDFSTKQGTLVKLVGSYYLRQAGTDGLGYALKLGVIDGLGSDAKTTAPANAFVRAPRGKAPAHKPIRFDSDTPGFALYVGGMDLSVTPTLEAIYEQKKFVLGFNRKAGQVDVLTTVDLRVAATTMVGSDVNRTYSDDAVNEFNYCTGELIRQIKAK